MVPNLVTMVAFDRYDRLVRSIRRKYHSKNVLRKTLSLEKHSENNHEQKVLFIDLILDQASVIDKLQF